MASRQLVNHLLTFITQLCANKRPPIAGFWPIGLELDIKPALYQLNRLGYPISLPKILELDAPLVFYQWYENAHMIPGHFAISEPALPDLAPVPEIVFVPVLGFTLRGDRLGYGKGYYDRTLAQWQADGHTPYTIGLSWDEGLIDDTKYQAAPHDVPLRRILTPSGFQY